jgi:hypothetical protein
MASAVLVGLQLLAFNFVGMRGGARAGMIKLK